MRIIAGRLRGRRVDAPGSGAVRPTYDRVRESVFGILDPILAGARVLDLFAGSGALGLESLSRDAEAATFVEIEPRVLRVVKANVERLGVGDRSRLVRRDATRLLEGPIPGGPFDVVFVDPPYASGLAGKALELLGRWDGLAPSATVVVEHGGGEDVLDSYGRLDVVRRKRYGDTEVAFFRLGDGESPAREEA
jgi:16S rRNA (guanine966-N2)-methyltransferase